MTAASINLAANDPQLQARVLATAQKEMVYNDELAKSEYGTRLRSGMYSIMELMWPIAADQENQYMAALQAGRGAPGHDRDIITDEALLSGVISFWPWTEEERPEVVPGQQEPESDPQAVEEPVEGDGGGQ